MYGTVSALALMLAVTGGANAAGTDQAALAASATARQAENASIVPWRRLVLIIALSHWRRSHLIFSADTRARVTPCNTCHSDTPVEAKRGQARTSLDTAAYCHSP
jgi:hypothetical protein